MNIKSESSESVKSTDSNPGSPLRARSLSNSSGPILDYDTDNTMDNVSSLPSDSEVQAFSSPPVSPRISPSREQLRKKSSGQVTKRRTQRRSLRGDDEESELDSEQEREVRLEDRRLRRKKSSKKQKSILKRPKSTIPSENTNGESRRSRQKTIGRRIIKVLKWPFHWHIEAYRLYKAEFFPSDNTSTSESESEDGGSEADDENDTLATRNPPDRLSDNDQVNPPVSEEKPFITEKPSIWKRIISRKPKPNRTNTLTPMAPELKLPVETEASTLDDVKSKSTESTPPIENPKKQSKLVRFQNWFKLWPKAQGTENADQNSFIPPALTEFQLYAQGFNTGNYWLPIPDPQTPDTFLGFQAQPIMGEIEVLPSDHLEVVWARQNLQGKSDEDVISNDSSSSSKTEQAPTLTKRYWRYKMMPFRRHRVIHLERVEQKKRFPRIRPPDPWYQPCKDLFCCWPCCKSDPENPDPSPPPSPQPGPSESQSIFRQCGGFVRFKEFESRSSCRFNRNTPIPPIDFDPQDNGSTSSASYSNLKVTKTNEQMSKDKI